jgi:hypothetical protein
MSGDNPTSMAHTEMKMHAHLSHVRISHWSPERFGKYLLPVPSCSR